ncbi:hypothetical protein [Chitinophaga sancti]|uniref:Uncharacterized protein n=1 Tax=Chitinophaga sancti TaxID=1004 RepID=A0A1K1RWZ3_9BACT|nr:hypothetical protein [Chitinophaga sancti]WQD64043.1 hypothetical protein U0033_06515 [Chitinophaga sancti]WQG90333.1 hypothetical protein SR876_02405 [Chitinophaga sancti]SFW76691.1 hypothetical protein SAMN05661012_04397 [Chitinophaga sancti]
MKQIVLMMMLIGGAVVGAEAQNGHRGNGYERGYRVHAGRWEDCNKSYRGAYYDCRPGARVMVPVPAPVAVCAPAPAPVVVYAPAPPPAQEVVYVKRPRVVINANISL